MEPVLGRRILSTELRWHEALHRFRFLLLQTAKMNAVDPQAWLTQTLERLANGWPSSEIDALMPWNYLRRGRLMATVTYVFTINHVAEMLGEDRELLEAIVSNSDNLTYGSIISVVHGDDEAITAETITARPTMASMS